MPLAPHCFVSDGVSLYAAFDGYDSTVNIPRYLANPSLVIARSNPYPTLYNLTWKVVATYRDWNIAFVALCAWNSNNSSIGITVRPDDRRLSPFILELSTSNDQSVLIHQQQSSTSTIEESGRSVLLHHNSSNGRGSGYPWMEIRLNQLSNQLEFIYSGSNTTKSGESQGRWDMVNSRQ